MTQLTTQEKIITFYDIPGKFAKITKLAGLATITSLFYNYRNPSESYLLPAMFSFGTYIFPGVRGTFELTGELLGDLVESALIKINKTGKMIKNSTKDATRAFLCGTMVLEDLVK